MPGRTRTGRHACRLVVVWFACVAGSMMADAPLTKRASGLRHSGSGHSATGELYLRRASQWRGREGAEQAVHPSRAMPQPAAGLAAAHETWADAAEKQRSLSSPAASGQQF